MRYPIVPGRGLNTKDAKETRLDFMKVQGIEVPLIADSRLDPEEFRHTIESYIGSVEIPVGLAGPLLFNDGQDASYVYAPVATLEGALVASMNRGAKTISESGGFNAKVLFQKMGRCPMFIFKDISECHQFKTWIDQHFTEIKEVAESYSNHASLIELSASIVSHSVHVHFNYTTGDASGQNMTTMCTSHAVKWIVEQFTLKFEFEPLKYVIEGNGASDKKVSFHSLKNGRGIHVIAECILDETVIERVLRVKVDEFLICLDQSRIICNLNGMVGYNINVANSIASIFLATGQDMACVHESSTGLLHLEKIEKGLYCSLQLPNLVIGTVGGGTHLFRQREALHMMHCVGSGQVGKLAKIIAGFALSLEISTFAAIVGGQFAKVHEKLGRNKPVNWLLRSEINQEFIIKNLNDPYKDNLETVKFLDRELVENGLIISLTKQVNKKLTGFIPLELGFKNTSDEGVNTKMVLIKSKPLDVEVYQGLYRMAASIDPDLADLISRYKDILEFKDCHLKEIEMYRYLAHSGYPSMPKFYGSYMDKDREIYTLAIELLDDKEMVLFNAENKPEMWGRQQIMSVIQSISTEHGLFNLVDNKPLIDTIPEIYPWHAKPLYSRFIKILGIEYDGSELGNVSINLNSFLNELEELYKLVKVPKTIVHNDFNPRNVAIRQSGEVCIYDWELAVYNFPHRDIVEFLSFTLPLGFDEVQLTQYLKYHFSLQDTTVPEDDWNLAYIYSLKEYMITRVMFYLTGKIQMDYLFAERIYLNTIRMIEILQNERL